MQHATMKVLIGVTSWVLVLGRRSIPKWDSYGRIPAAAMGTSRIGQDVLL